MYKYIAIILLMFTLSFFGCSNLKKEDSSVISDSTIANCTYFMPDMPDLCDTIKLTSGAWEKEERIDSEYVDRQFMNLYKVAYGNINDDDKIDAAVVLALCTGGSGIFVSINVVVDSNSAPFHLAYKYIGDRIDVDTLFIRDHVIHMRAIIQRYDQGACCPDSTVNWQFRLKVNHLEEITGATF
jgi:hypothetical protein